MPLAAARSVKWDAVNPRLKRWVIRLARVVEQSDYDVWIWVTSGKRTTAEQARLKTRGLTTASGYEAPHVQGRAVDLAFGFSDGPVCVQDTPKDWWTWLHSVAAADGLQSPAGSSYPGHVQLPKLPALTRRTRRGYE